MAQSGVQKENLDANEVQQRDAMQRWLSQTPNSLHQDGGHSTLRCRNLLFSPPGSVRLADPERNLPAWFMDGYKRYCSMAQSLSFSTVRILFVHCNYPAQFRHLSQHLAANKNNRNCLSLSKQRVDSRQYPQIETISLSTRP